MRKGRTEGGFSLLEMMVVIGVLTIVMGAVFTTVNQVQQRSSHEQVKLDQFQESREFADQLTRDLHQAGYPNLRVLTGVNASSSTLAVGLVKVDSGDLWFEGDVDGDGQVDTVRYHLDMTGTNCPCLRRSARPKDNGVAPMNQGFSYETEVQNVQNTDIFRAVEAGTGTETALPIDFAANPMQIASTGSIRVRLRVQAPTPDLQTGLRPETNIESAVQLNNCSSAVSGGLNSCL